MESRNESQAAASTPESKVLAYLRRAAQDGASDLYLVAGGSVSEKVEQRMRVIDTSRLLPQDTAQMIAGLYQLAGRSWEEHTGDLRDNFSLSVPNVARFRVNVFHQRGSVAAVVRVIKFGLPDAEALGLPAQVMSLASERRGLILVTGLAGSGKSTTQACLINQINATREGHIITIEDPIEYLHRNQRSLVSQQEVAIDVEDTLSALNNCLQQAPDVIFLSEMESADIIRSAITAAETGRLVIGTLYTKDAVSTIDYVIHSFPTEYQEGIRIQLSMALKAVVSQQLLPTQDGTLTPAFEVLRVNRTVQTMIRENRISEISKEIAASSRDDMLSLDKYILQLYCDGVITRDVAMDSSADPEDMRRKMWMLGD